MSDEFNARSFSHTRTFFMTCPVSNADGTMDFGSEVPSGFGTVEDAVEAATRDVDEHGGAVIIYECWPVRRVRRCDIVVDDLTVPSPNKQGRE